MSKMYSMHSTRFFSQERYYDEVIVAKRLCDNRIRAIRHWRRGSRADNLKKVEYLRTDLLQHMSFFESASPDNGILFKFVYKVRQLDVYDDVSIKYLYDYMGRGYPDAGIAMAGHSPPLVPQYAGAGSQGATI